jgi:hypothetical protein
VTLGGQKGPRPRHPRAMAANLEKQVTTFIFDATRCSAVKCVGLMRRASNLRMRKPARGRAIACVRWVGTGSCGLDVLVLRSRITRRHNSFQRQPCIPSEAATQRGREEAHPLLARSLLPHKVPLPRLVPSSPGLHKWGLLASQDAGCRMCSCRAWLVSSCRATWLDAHGLRYRHLRHPYSTPQLLKQTRSASTLLTRFTVGNKNKCWREVGHYNDGTTPPHLARKSASKITTSLPYMMTT